MVRNNLFEATKVVTFFQSAKYFHTFFHPPAGASLQLVPNSKFKIPPHNCALPPLFRRGGTGVRIKKTLANFQSLPKCVVPPLAQVYSLCPIQNSQFKIPSPVSQFKIQNSEFKILFTAHCPPPFWAGGTGVRNLIH